MLCQFLGVLILNLLCLVTLLVNGFFCVVRAVLKWQGRLYDCSRVPTDGFAFASAEETQGFHGLGLVLNVDFLFWRFYTTCEIPNSRLHSSVLHRPGV